jgi:adenylate cyclase
MPKEIERKFLVTGDGWREATERAVRYRQGYLAGSERSSVRVRLSDREAWLNIKSATLGVERLEYEYAIPLNEAEEMLDRLCEGHRIDKTRHYVPLGRHTWEVDVFEGGNAGLVVAEIELNAPHEAFQRPDWVGEEVSDDPRYYNVYLAEHPYKSWR